MHVLACNFLLPGNISSDAFDSVSHLNIFCDLNHSEGLSFVVFIAYYFRMSFISPHCIEIYSILNFEKFRILLLARENCHSSDISYWEIKTITKRYKDSFVCNLFSLLNQLTVLKLFKWLKSNLNKLWTFLNRYAI